MHFTYRALNKDGSSLAGMVEAASLKEAIRTLQRQGLNVVDVKQEQRKQRKKARGFKGKAGKKDIIVLLYQLCTLLESKVTLEETLESLSESVTQPDLAAKTSAMATTIRRGGSLSKALKDSGLPLPSYFLPLAEAGELTGKIDKSLRQGVEQWEHEMKLATEFRSALVYPCVLILFGLISIMAIFVVVVPKFTKLLDRAQGEIPLLAKVIMGTGTYVNENLQWVGIGAAVILCMVLYGLKSEKIRQNFRDVVAKMPFFRHWMLEAQLGSWAGMLSTLLENKVALIDALSLSQKFLSITDLRSKMSLIIQSVKGGVSLSEAMVNINAITSLGYNLIRVGERTGELPTMLRSLSTLYVQSVRTRTKRMLVIIEPLAIIMIGGVIGLIMAGIILAIVSVNNIAV